MTSKVKCREISLKTSKSKEKEEGYSRLKFQIIMIKNNNLYTIRNLKYHCSKPVFLNTKNHLEFPPHTQKLKGLFCIENPGFKCWYFLFLVY